MTDFRFNQCVGQSALMSSKSTERMTQLLQLLRAIKGRLSNGLFMSHNSGIKKRINVV